MSIEPLQPRDFDEVEHAPEMHVEDMVPYIVPVKMERSGPADNAVYTTVTLDASVSTAGYPLLGEDDRRKRALVWTDGVIYIGKRETIGAGAGARLPIGLAIELQSSAELWARCPTGTANVSIVNERWSTP